MSNAIGKHCKTRFCPSPTGLVHLGNIRTALFNALLAKHAQGRFLLRIEDTDRERSKEEYDIAMQEDLLWLGMDWQEGPGHDGGLGPYHQSKRQAIYDDYYKRLEEAQGAYACFCTEDELKLMRKLQRSSGKPPRYNGKCRSLTAGQVAEKFEQGLQATLRFCVPENETIEFTDLVRGPLKFNSDDIGDFIIRRANGTSPFMFCNAIDDAMMEVTHVMRGEDHVTNTPRQIMILEALGLPIPTYAHISLIVAMDGSPLSKRNGSRSIQELRTEGYLPAAINNYLARLGHYYGHDDLLSLDELAAQFNTEALSKSPAKFNEEQLNHWQNKVIAALDADALLAWLGEENVAQVPAQQRAAFVEMVAPNIHFPADAKLWSDVIFNTAWQVQGDAMDIIKSATPNYFSEALKAMGEHGQDSKAIMQHLKTNLNVKGKALFQPLRVALTGEQHGPELAKLMQLMDTAEMTRRLENAAKC